MIDLNKKFENKEFLKSLLAFCKNYMNRTEYLERENLITDKAREGVQKNYNNAIKIIPILESKINE